jgi:hypothetical protein
VMGDVEGDGEGDDVVGGAVGASVGVRGAAVGCDRVGVRDGARVNVGEDEGRRVGAAVGSGGGRSRHTRPPTVVLSVQMCLELRLHPVRVHCTVTPSIDMYTHIVQLKRRNNDYLCSLKLKYHMYLKGHIVCTFIVTEM